MEPGERLAEIAKLVEPYLNRHGNSEVGDLARSIRKLTDAAAEPRPPAGV